MTFSRNFTSPRFLTAWRVSALGAALLWAAAPIATFAAETWLEIRGTDFRLVGHSSPDRLRNVACDLERVSRALRPMRSAVTPFTTPVVIAAAGERDMRELLSQYWEQRGARPVGAYWAGAFGHHVVVRIDAPPRERIRRILHEYAHFVTHARGAEPPKWLDEGLSELWTHAAIESDQIVLGQPVKQHLSALRSDADWLPVQELTSAKELPSPQNRKQVARFYAASWALAHYLVAGQPGGLRNAENPNTAPLPTDEILRAYIRTSQLPSLSLQAPESPASCEGTVRTLPISESISLRSKALVDSPRPEAAETLLRAQLAQEPNDSSAMEVLGLVYFLGNRSIQATQAFDKVISSGRASHVAYYYRAILTTPLNSDYLKRSLDLNPDFLPARERLRELQARH